MQLPSGVIDLHKSFIATWCRTSCIDEFRRQVILGGFSQGGAVAVRGAQNMEVGDVFWTLELSQGMIIWVSTQK